MGACAAAWGPACNRRLPALYLALLAMLQLHQSLLAALLLLHLLLQSLHAALGNMTNRCKPGC